MEIKYLKQLNNNPTIDHDDSDYVRTLQPISIEEIASLENSYNNGHSFPTALRELLYLAGKYCYVLDYGRNNSQQEMQEQAREDLTDYDRNLSISRPFFVIDVYNSGDQFLFVYLDEGVDDPIVYEAVLDPNPLSSRGWINSLQTTLSQYINSRLINILGGFNPY